MSQTPPKATKEVVREQVWAALRRVARPDSRFHWDFSCFIPDYEGSEEGSRRIASLPEWKRSRLAFITPDNNLEGLRRRAMDEGKPFVMSTYGIARGFLYVDPGKIGVQDRSLAATLDGIERFGRPVRLAELASFGRMDLLVTGASGVSLGGVRFGKGHGYFDLEWAMFSEVGCLAEDPRVVCAVHECQVVEGEVEASEFDTRVDLIVTPKRTIHVPKGQGHRPGRVDWARLHPGMIEQIPPLLELSALQRKEPED